MIKQLEAIFPSLITMDDSQQIAKNDYKWFITAENEVIGIDQHDLTKKDVSLLTAFLTPYNINLPTQTTREQQWTQLAKNDQHQASLEQVDTYRFVYFSFPVNKLDPSAFKEAIRDIFTREVPVLWESDHSGIMVEEDSESLSYNQIVDVLMSDLYVKINFFVGPYLADLKKARHYYQTLLTYAKTFLDHNEKPVMSYIDMIPALMMDQINPGLRNSIPKIVLQDTLDDRELLQTIETFIHCNLNISNAAKELYMHRNSLQYRIDKFIEKTGIDIRQFDQAMTVQLALLAKKHNN